MMTLRAWINDKLPTWAWNLKNRLTGNPYREHVQRNPTSTWSTLKPNFSTSSDTLSRQLYWRDADGKTGIIDMDAPKHGVAGISYRDPQGTLVEYVPTPSSASGEE